LVKHLELLLKKGDLKERLVAKARAFSESDLVNLGTAAKHVAEFIEAKIGSTKVIA